MIGKYLNGYSNKPLVPPGWSEWHAAAPDTQDVYDYTLNENGSLVHFGQTPADFKQDVLTSRAVDFVDRRARKPKPFFLWLTYTAPHGSGPNPNPNPPLNCERTAKPAPRHAHAFDSEPLPRPPNFNEADVSDKPAAMRRLPLLNASDITDIQRKYRCRLESILSVDDGVKAIIDELRARRELDNTLIVYTSDNGFFHGEHRIPTGKLHIYEESIRVPLEMRGPGIPRGVSVSDPAINADLAPTIVDAANANPGLVMDGLSLIPVAQNPGIESGRELLVEQPGFEAIRTERYMYAEYNTGEQELYDLLKDPFELQSRHNAPAYAVGQGPACGPPARAAELRRRQLPHPALAAARPSSRLLGVVLRPGSPPREILRGRCRRRSSRSFGRSSRRIWRERHRARSHSWTLSSSSCPLAHLT